MRFDFDPVIPFLILEDRSVDSVTVDGAGSRCVTSAGRAGSRRRLEDAPRRTSASSTWRSVAAAVGAPGRPTVVYWASWCATCRGQALELQSLLARPGGTPWDLLGIGGDTDRAAALSFRSEFGATYPTSFSGGYTTQDPVARLYQEAVVGVFYVVGPDGILADKATDVEALRAALEKLSASAGEERGSGTR